MHDSSEREFAGDRTPGAIATGFPVEIASPVPTSPVAVATAMESFDLLALRPVQNQFAMLDQQGMHLIDVDSRDARLVWKRDDRHVWSFDLSPDGSKIAMLVSSGKPDSDWTVLILDAEGAEQAEIALSSPRATPGPAPDVVIAGTGGIAWHPDNDQRVSKQISNRLGDGSNQFRRCELFV